MEAGWQRLPLKPQEPSGRWAAVCIITSFSFIRLVGLIDGVSYERVSYGSVNARSESRGNFKFKKKISLSSSFAEPGR